MGRQPVLGKGHEAGREELGQNGALRFVVGEKARAACYDANGNMTGRLQAGVAYLQGYDAENRLSQATNLATGQVSSFVYGPDGSRVKGTVGGVTTVYVGDHYEVQGSTVRKYYYAGAQRVAMRQNTTLYWLLADHLGSTAITANGTTGAKVAEVRYKAWGENRYTSGTTPTTYRFTGQRQEAGVGLYDYGARWYDPYIQRWISPDTIIPQPANPQSLNRYSYVLNSPLRFTDPSGMWEQESDDYTDPDSETLDAAAEAASEVTYQGAKAAAYDWYCANYAAPFEDTQPITDPFGSPRSYGTHRGTDYGGSFGVYAPFAGTVTHAGSSHEAGMWKIKENATGAVSEWSVWGGTLLHTGDEEAGKPASLLATGSYTDMEPGWSHTEGTAVEISIGHDLTTRFEHLDSLGNMTVRKGQTVSKGEALGVTNNNGWSTGAHLHYGLIFSWGGRTEYLNPVPPAR